MILLAFIGPQEIMVLLLLLPLLALISVLMNRFHGNEKLLWILAILLLPFLGALLYFFIGRNKRIRK